MEDNRCIRLYLEIYLNAGTGLWWVFWEYVGGEENHFSTLTRKEAYLAGREIFELAELGLEVDEQYLTKHFYWVNYCVERAHQREIERPEIDALVRQLSRNDSPSSEEVTALIERARDISEQGGNPSEQEKK